MWGVIISFLRMPQPYVYLLQPTHRSICPGSDVKCIWTGCRFFLNNRVWKANSLRSQTGQLTSNFVRLWKTRDLQSSEHPGHVVWPASLRAATLNVISSTNNSSFDQPQPKRWDIVFQIKRSLMTWLAYMFQTFEELYTCLYVCDYCSERLNSFSYLHVIVTLCNTHT